MRASGVLVSPPRNLGSGLDTLVLQAAIEEGFECPDLGYRPLVLSTSVEVRGGDQTLVRITAFLTDERSRVVLWSYRHAGRIGDLSEWPSAARVAAAGIKEALTASEQSIREKSDRLMA